MRSWSQGDVPASAMQKLYVAVRLGRWLQESSTKSKCRGFAVPDRVEDMKITRQWAMPNKNTFSIKPINELVSRVIANCHEGAVIDPFFGKSPFGEYCVSNDINPEIDADFHIESLDFLKGYASQTCGIVLFDPPYSPRQVSECYKKLDMTVNMQTTQSKFWGDMKKEISRIVMVGGCVVSCGWNSGGIGKTHGFEIEEILMVAHGGWHNDTIVTIERKIARQADLFASQS